MEKLKTMKEQLIAAAQTQMGNLQNVDAKELGEVVDMIKDLEEAIYYCTITEAMHEKEEKDKEQHHHYYTERMIDPYDRHYMPKRYPDEYYMRDMDKDFGKMYYDGGLRGMRSNTSTTGKNGSYNYTEMMYPYPLEMRDSREGKSPISRKTYIESKEMHKDKTVHMKELEKYMTELSQDIIEMIEGASPEEQQYLERKISQLATKIGRVSN